jgi:hypothetical protein
MASYQSATISGEAWTRCPEITVSNPTDGQPLIAFREERVALIGNEKLITPLGRIVTAFDPAAEIPLRNPETMELTGDTITHGSVYAILYSAYIYAATTRDAAQHESQQESQHED